MRITLTMSYFYALHSSIPLSCLRPISNGIIHAIFALPWRGKRSTQPITIRRDGQQSKLNNKNNILANKICIYKNTTKTKNQKRRRNHSLWPTATCYRWYCKWYRVCGVVTRMRIRKSHTIMDGFHACFRYTVHIQHTQYCLTGPNTYRPNGRFQFVGYFFFDVTNGANMMIIVSDVAVIAMRWMVAMQRWSYIHTQTDRRTDERRWCHSICGGIQTENVKPNHIGADTVDTQITAARYLTRRDKSITICSFSILFYNPAKFVRHIPILF